MLTGGTLQGRASGDASAARLGFTRGIGKMSNANVGNGKKVTTTIKLTGTAAANYTLKQPAVTVNITKLKLSTPKSLKLTATNATWSSVPHNNGYTLVVRHGTKTVFTKNIKKNATKVSFTAKERKLMQLPGNYTFRLFAKATSNTTVSNTATSGRLAVK